MKKFICCISLLLTVSFVFAQSETYQPVNNPEIYIGQISAMSKNTISLKCDFIQEKSSSMLSEKLISKGCMYFKTPNSLRWEYREPNQLVLIFKDEHFLIKSNDGVTTNANRIFKEISKLIIDLMNGEELSNNNNFKSDFYTNGHTLWIKMTPKKKQIEQMFSLVELYIDSRTGKAEQIVMHEASGDNTTIHFVNVKRNAIFDNSVFELE